MKYKIFLILFIVCYIILNPTAKASHMPGNLILIPDYENYFDPNFFYVYLYIQPNSQTINATEINLNFDNSILSAADADFTDSFCNLFIHSNIDNFNGNLNIQCGRPNGMSGDNIFVAKIKFNKLQTGWAKLNLTDSQIFLNDGLGTNVLTENNTYNILIEK